MVDIRSIKRFDHCRVLTRWDEGVTPKDAVCIRFDFVVVGQQKVWRVTTVDPRDGTGLRCSWMIGQLAARGDGSFGTAEQSQCRSLKNVGAWRLSQARPGFRFTEDAAHVLAGLIAC